MRAIIAIIAVLSTACASVSSVGGADIPSAGHGEPVRLDLVDGNQTARGVSAQLQPAASCDDLLEQYIALALEQVGPWGLGYEGGVVFDEVASQMEASGEGAARADTATSHTNNQVAGIDEADTVKNDGSHIYALVDSRLEVARIDTDGVTQVGTLELDWYPQSLLLDGDNLIVLGGEWQRFPVEPMMADAMWIGPSLGRTTIGRIDISDRTAPALVETLVVDGSLVGARMVDGRVQLAVNTGPVGFSWKTPAGSGMRAESAALEANRRLIEESTLDNWLPWYRHTDSDGEEISEGRFTDCSGVMVPREPSGLSTLTLATFDGDLGDWQSAGVVATATTYYATADHTYLATSRWDQWNRPRIRGGSVQTDIHLFSTAPAPSYVASGSVEGTLIGQFALDEYEDVLRVASTTGQWDGRSESMVTTLEATDQELVELGRVDGLGKGEQIYSVRFIGDMGYVVTFRQVDPLYTIDLSDPSAPTAVGELKITGYSAYLHPVGDGRLLGVGQEADSNGQVSGTQVSLFDISDPAEPVRLDQIHIEGAWSEAESDHHAFTFFEGLALTPFTVWDWERKGDGVKAGILALEVGADSLGEATELVSSAEDTDFQDPWAMTPTRTIVTPDLIIGVGPVGMSVHSRSSLEWVDFVEFLR